MKMKLLTLTLLSVLTAVLLSVPANAQTTTTTTASGTTTTTDGIQSDSTFSKGLKEMSQTFSTFFKDNTNFFGQKNVIVGLDAAYSKGHDTALSGAADKDTYGAVLNVGFPLDANGQVQIGLWAAYFNNSVFYGSFQTTLGTTFTVPSWVPLLKGEQVFAFNEGGPGYRFGQGQGGIFGQDFVGAVWKHQFGTSRWTLFVDGAYGKISIWDNPVYLGGVKLSYSF